MPQSLLNYLTAVYKAVTRDEPIALRAWAEFTVALCDAGVDLNGVIDPNDAIQLIGQNLVSLGLFPHASLSEDPRKMEAALRNNRRLTRLSEPKGAALRELKLVAVIEDARAHEFRGPLGEELTDQERLDVSENIVKYCESALSEHREVIDFSQFMSLFEGMKSETKKLGERVEEELKLNSASDPDPLSAFHESQLRKGLDDNEPKAARQLMDLETAEESSVFDSLSKALRKRIENLALPSDVVRADPLFMLLEAIDRSGELEESRGGPAIHLGLDRRERVPWLTLLVFSTLYGPSLGKVADLTDSSDHHQLTVDPALLRPSSLEEIEAEGEPSQEGSESDWGALRLLLRIGDNERLFRWDPEDLIEQAATVAEIRGMPRQEPGELTASQWIATHGQGLAGVRSSQVSYPSNSDWDVERGNQLKDMAINGVSTESLAAYFDSWTARITSLRREVIQSGQPIPEIDAVMDQDAVLLSAETSVVLATHPLRARWLGRHFQALIADCAAALLIRPSDDGLADEELNGPYFESIRQRSPHALPAELVTGPSTRLLPSQTLGQHQAYELHKEASASLLDTQARLEFEDLESILTDYALSYPESLDRLSILIILPTGDSGFIRRLTKWIQEKHPRDRLELYVATPQSQRSSVISALHALSISPAASDHAQDDHRSSILPRVLLRILDQPTGSAGTEEWNRFADSLQSELAGEVDIAVAPNLFSRKVQISAKTKNADATAGTFDPVQDSSSHKRVSNTGAQTNVEVELLPQCSDQALETWSTLSVRRHQNGPVAEDAPYNTDYSVAQVAFHEAGDLFKQLHGIASWVVTVDQYIGREQIDALEDAPDVIKVRTRMSAGIRQSVIVSSLSGREFVTRGLERRLVRNLKMNAEENALDTARNLYNAAAAATPNLLLRSLGLGRSLEELVGLIAARAEAAEAFPWPEGATGFDCWISLDEHTDWFGGNSRIRADLARIRITESRDGALDVHLLALESKFRRSVDDSCIGTARKQLDRTLRIMTRALDPKFETEESLNLRRFWRSMVLRAIDETSRRTESRNVLPPLNFHIRSQSNGNPYNPSELVERAREAFTHGDYNFSSSSLIVYSST
ncbi:MAG: hypothetical protein WCJ63_04820, partial [Actinomycetes bacterium]